MLLCVRTVLRWGVLLHESCVPAVLGMGLRHLLLGRACCPQLLLRSVRPLVRLVLRWQRL